MSELVRYSDHPYKISLEIGPVAAGLIFQGPDGLKHRIPDYDMMAWSLSAMLIESNTLPLERTLVECVAREFARSVLGANLPAEKHQGRRGAAEFRSTNQLYVDLWENALSLLERLRTLGIWPFDYPGIHPATMLMGLICERFLVPTMLFIPTGKNGSAKEINRAQMQINKALRSLPDAPKSIQTPSALRTWLLSHVKSVHIKKLCGLDGVFAQQFLMAVLIGCRRSDAFQQKWLAFVSARAAITQLHDKSAVLVSADTGRRVSQSGRKATKKVGQTKVDR